MSKYFNKYYWIRKLFVNSFFSKFVNQRLLNKIVFNSIYKSNHWNKSQKLDLNQSYSGPGSAANSIQTNNLISELEKFFKEINIKNILDAPCGDCAWISKIFDTNIKYTGIDIVKDLINENKTKIVIQINGKKRGLIETNKDITEINLMKNIDQDEKISKYLKGNNIKKKIFIPGKLINIII